MNHLEPLLAFGLDAASIRAGYARNAAQLLQMADQAKVSGGKIRGYTEAQLRERAAKFAKLANPL